jgi:phosphate:Na+ symporter
MSKTAIETFKSTLQRIEDRDYKKLSRWKRIENFLDSTQREITAYLTKIYQNDLTEPEAKEISSLMRMTNNIERIGDSVENIAQVTEIIIENKIPFTSTAMADIKKISGKVLDFLNHVTVGIKSHDKDFMERAIQLENDIDSMRENMRQDHIKRLRRGECKIDPGLIYIDLLSNFEKIGDYCFNIAQAVAGLK